MRSTVSEVPSVSGLRAEIVGINQKVLLFNGQQQTFVHLDHAACTPAFRTVIEKMAASLEWYGDAQHGAGHRALASQNIYARAQAETLAFTGADEDEDMVYYGKNTSEVLGVLSRCIHWEPGDVVLTTELNALSSEIPWQGKAQVVCAGMDRNGFFDLRDLEKKLVKFAGRVKLVTVNGAGAITGAVPPVHAAAELVHNFRAYILAECGQVAAHRPVHKGRADSLAQVDFMTLSGQKMYAPVGIAALIGSKQHLGKVTETYGTPNLAGAAAMAASMEILSAARLDAIARYEAQLAGYARTKLRRIPGCKIAGDSDPVRFDDSLGYLSFTVEGIPAARLAAILAYEAGVGVGCVGLNQQAQAQAMWSTYPQKEGLQFIHFNDADHGLVRVSFGCYNDFGDIDRLVEGVERVAHGDIRGEYVTGADGRYFPLGFDPFEVQENLF